VPCSKRASATKLSKSVGPVVRAARWPRDLSQGQVFPGLSRWRPPTGFNLGKADSRPPSPSPQFVSAGALRGAWAPARAGLATQAIGLRVVWNEGCVSSWVSNTIPSYRRFGVPRVYVPRRMRARCRLLESMSMAIGGVVTQRVGPGCGIGPQCTPGPWPSCPESAGLNRAAWPRRCVPLRLLVGGVAPRSGPFRAGKFAALCRPCGGCWGARWLPLFFSVHRHCRAGGSLEILARAAYSFLFAWVCGVLIGGLDGWWGVCVGLFVLFLGVGRVLSNCMWV